MARAAATKASAMPVLPNVGSISTEPGPIFPSRSSASIIDTPMRSLTLPIGLKNSSLARMLALTHAVLFRQPVEPDDGCYADRVGDGIEYAPTTLHVGPRGRRCGAFTTVSDMIGCSTTQTTRAIGDERLLMSGLFSQYFRT